MVEHHHLHIKVQSSKSVCVSSQHFHSAFNPQFAKTSGFCTWYLHCNPQQNHGSEHQYFREAYSFLLSSVLYPSICPVLRTSFICEWHNITSNYIFRRTSYLLYSSIKTQTLAKIYIKGFKDCNLKM